MTEVRLCYKSTAPSVEVVGSFNAWKPVPMHPDPDGTGFELALTAPEGLCTFQFVVDGVARHDESQPFFAEKGGEIVNYLIPNAQVIEPPALYAERLVFQNQLLINGVVNARKEPESTWGQAADPTEEDALSPRTFAAQIAMQERKLAIVMVGLPARGKSFISTKLGRYLRWKGFSCKVFASVDVRKDRSYRRSAYFARDNKEGCAAREELCRQTCENALQYLRTDGAIAIINGAHVEERRRKTIQDMLTKDSNVKVMFIEIISNDEALIERNLQDRTETLECKEALAAGLTTEEFMQDYRERVKQFELAYETVSNPEYSYLKVIDVGLQTVTNRVSGYVPTRIVDYLSNLSIAPRPIYLTRHGESEFNAEDRIGGDAPLTSHGRQYARRLTEFMQSRPVPGTGGDQFFDPALDLCAWTSTLIRTIQTSEMLLCAQRVRWKSLDEIDGGVCEGLTFAEFKEKYPQDFKARAADKLRYRYPCGESYQDLIQRLEPVIFEMERQRMPIIIIAHRAVIRCLKAYFLDLPVEMIPTIDVPLNTLFKVDISAARTNEWVFHSEDEGPLTLISGTS